MMNENVIIEKDADISVSLKCHGDNELFYMLKEEIEITVSSLKRAAAIWKELKRRGYEMKGIETGVANYLSDISSGKLLPEAVIRCAGQKTLLKNIRSVDLKTQNELLLNGATIVEISGNGYNEKIVPLHELNTKEVRVLFDKNKIRKAGEQIDFLEKEKNRKKRRKTLNVNVEFERGEYDLLKKLAMKLGRKIPDLLHDMAMNALSEQIGNC